MECPKVLHCLKKTVFQGSSLQLVLLFEKIPPLVLSASEKKEARPSSRSHVTHTADQQRAPIDETPTPQPHRSVDPPPRPTSQPGLPVSSAALPLLDSISQPINPETALIFEVIFLDCQNGSNRTSHSNRATNHRPIHFLPTEAGTQPPQTISRYCLALQAIWSYFVRNGHWH